VRWQLQLPLPVESWRKALKNLTLWNNKTPPSNTLLRQATDPQNRAPAREFSVCVCVCVSLSLLSSTPFHPLYRSVCRSGALARGSTLTFAPSAISWSSYNGNICLLKRLIHCKKIFSRFVITTYFLLSNQLYNNLFSWENLLFWVSDD